MKRDRILLAGARGQLGETLANLHMQSPLNLKYELIPLDSDGMNLINRSSIKGALSKYSPSVIINCAAYTFVDKAEEEPSLSKKINDEAVDVLAKWSNDNQCRLIQISTDYVFDGKSNIPYNEIGIMHLAAGIWQNGVDMRVDKNIRVNIKTLDGKIIEKSLRNITE